MLSRANARLRMGDLVIEAGAFKVGASSKDAQALLREKLDQDGILADIAQIDQEVSGQARRVVLACLSVALRAIVLRGEAPWIVAGGDR